MEKTQTASSISIGTSVCFCGKWEIFHPGCSFFDYYCYDYDFDYYCHSFFK